MKFKLCFRLILLCLHTNELLILNERTNGIFYNHSLQDMQLLVLKSLMVDDRAGGKETDHKGQFFLVAQKMGKDVPKRTLMEELDVDKRQYD